MTIKKLSFCLLLIIIFYPSLSSAEKSAHIIQKVEDNLNGKSAIMKITMVVKTRRSERSIRMESYSKGKKEAFIKILYPGKDKGITFLKIDGSMWQYVPRIEKIIKIPASMMLQSWMGSDFTNDDLVRESSISEDYNSRLLGETGDVFEVELIPNEEAAVVWGRIIMEISKVYYLPVKALYYDEEDVLIRELTYSNIESFGKRYYPTRWTMIPKETGKSDHETIIEVSEALFDSDISNAYFTKRALKRFSE